MNQFKVESSDIAEKHPEYFNAELYKSGMYTKTSLEKIKRKYKNKEIAMNYIFTLKDKLGKNVSDNSVNMENHFICFEFESLNPINHDDILLQSILPNDLILEEDGVARYKIYNKNLTKSDLEKLLINCGFVKEKEVNV